MAELSPEAAALVAATRTADDPTPDDEVRVHRALLAAIAAPAIGAAASSTAAAAATGGVAGAGAIAGGSAVAGGSAALGGGAIAGSTALGGAMGMKALVVAVVAATVAGGGYVAVQSVTEPEAPAVDRAAAEAPLDQRRGASESRNASAPAVREPAEREPDIREPDIREPDIREPGIREPGIREPVQDAHEEMQPGAGLADRSRGARPTVLPRPPHAGHRVARAEATSPGVPFDDEREVESGAAERRRDPLREEIELLGAADGALRSGNGARALELTEHHRTRFPHGQLARDRDVVHVLALCAVGRVDEARTRAVPLFARYAGTPAAQRLTTSCAQEVER